MVFASPYALLFLLGIIPIIIIYMLKQKFRETEVSSIYLWNEVLKEIQADTPFQKLKKNLLMFLQIIIIILITFAIVNPVINVQGKAYGNLIIVVDNTASMRSKYKNETIMDYAKEQIKELIKNSADSTKFTIIEANANSRIDAVSAKKSEALAIVSDINATNKILNVENVTSLVDSLKRQYKGSKAVFFTDEDLKLKGMNVYSLRNIKLKNWNNTSLDLISYVENDGKLDVLVKITNRSSKSEHREVLLYAENKLLDMKDVDLKKHEERYVYFNDVNVDMQKKYICAETEEKDSIAEDNKIYEKLGLVTNKKVMLFSKGNVFLEKAIATIKSVKLYKNIELNNVPSGYDVYIFDGMKPKELPKQGGLIFINTGGKNVNAMGDLKILKNPVTKYMNGNFIISKINMENMPNRIEPLINVGETTAVAIGKYRGLNTAWINFDLHDSNFPLTQDFPIFTNNLLKGFLEAEARTSKIDLPENFPSYSESKIGKSRAMSKLRDNGLKEIENVKMQKSLRNIFIILALIFMTLEWKVYKNG